MNCQDISRIVDCGNIRELGEPERSAAEAHARSCQDCAVIWGVQSRLARVRVPPTPPAVAAHLRMLAALPNRQARGHLSRRLTVIGSLVALAAAAGIWIWQRADWGVPEPMARNLDLATEPAAKVPAEITAAPATQDDAEASTVQPLPLVPEPKELPATEPAKSSLAMQRIAERHRELVEGPQLDDTALFFVSLLMRADGSVLDSAAELASPATATETSDRLAQRLPADGGELFPLALWKGQQLPGGGTVRARTYIRAMLMRDGFDMARSDVRVREILGHRYYALLLPPTSNDTNVLTVLLANDGRILREKVERLGTQLAATMPGASDAVPLEDRIASKLGLVPEQLGPVGRTMLTQGSRRVVKGQDGLSQLEGDWRSLRVLYAWAREAGEAEPARMPEATLEEDPDIDLAAALIVAKRLFPESFTRAPPASPNFLVPIPAVVFTAKGEVIRAGHVQMRSGVPTDTLLQQQLVPGISTGLDRIVRLTDEAGAVAIVHFAWQRTER